MPSLDVRLKAARRKLEQLQAKARKEDRAARTHRLITYGLAFLAMVAAMPEAQRGAMLARVHKYVMDEPGRRRLGLALLPKHSEGENLKEPSDVLLGMQNQGNLPFE